MSEERMSAMERVLTALGHEEPDRVPFFLFLTTHGARELGLSIKEYFSSAESVVEGQIRLRARFGHDCLLSFFHAPLEVEAWGGEVVFVEDGPPNSGVPFIRGAEAIADLTPPRVSETPCLVKVLRATEMLKAQAGDEVPIIGVVMSPFSLPVMQMGFGPYLRLLHEQRPLFDRLMELNEAFCVEWANAQLASGATAICYFDPVSSPTIVPRDLYLATGHPVACRTIARIKGPTATHMASGRVLPIIDDLSATGTAAVGVGVDEDLAEVGVACRGRLSVIGNLNGIEMRRWSTRETEDAVRGAMAAAAAGGGFILADNHGEIPWYVPCETLATISEAVRRWGFYPLRDA